MSLPLAPRRWQQFLLVGWCLAIACLALRPVLGPGFSLTYDMVFVPRPAWTPSLVGAGPELPRAVPSDALVAVVSRLLPGATAQAVILVLILFLAAFGVTQLVPSHPGARAAAALAVVGNPWVSERLAIGQWALLMGYAALPWCIRAVIAVGRGEIGALPRLVLASALAAAGGGSSAVVAALATLLTGAVTGGGNDGRLSARVRTLGTAISVIAVLNAPWWVPALMRPADLPVDQASVSAFAARAEPPLDLVSTVISGGGIWNADVVAPERASAGLAWLSVAFALLGLLALATLSRRATGAVALLVCAAAGGVLALGAVGPIHELVGWVVTAVPGGGLLRDAHKFVALCALAGAAGVGWLVSWLCTGPFRRSGIGIPAAVAMGLLPLILAPSLWLGLEELDGVHYPSDYGKVQKALSGTDWRDTLVVLPWQPYRAYEWTNGRTVLDPLPRLLPTTTVVDDDLAVGEVTVSGEGAASDALDRTMSSDAALAEPLARSRIRWVAVEHRSGVPEVAPTRTAGLRAVITGRDIDLWQVPGVEPRAGADLMEEIRPPLAPVLLADLLAAALLLTAVGQFSRARRRSARDHAAAERPATLR